MCGNHKGDRNNSGNKDNKMMTAAGRSRVAGQEQQQQQHHYYHHHQNHRQMAARMALSLNGLVLATCVAFLVLSLGSTLSYNGLVNCQEQQLNIESRQQKDGEDLNDTIKYLEKLDQYFSQMSRPRFGRSEYKQPVALANSGQVFQTRPIEYPARFSSLADLINGRLARRYAQTNF